MSLIRLHQYGTCDKSKNRQTRWRQKGWEDAGQQQPIILNLAFPDLAGIDRHPAVPPHPLHPLHPGAACSIRVSAVGDSDDGGVVFAGLVGILWNFDIYMYMYLLQSCAFYWLHCSE